MAKADSKRRSPRFKDLTGKRFSRLLVVRDTGKISHGSVEWLCVCDCGSTMVVPTRNLNRGAVRSCGCLRHGMADTKVYSTWCRMISRCKTTNLEHYACYGARGIKVCDEWKNSFEAFYADVGDPPSQSHSLDRYPNTNGNYEPGNVRWATAKEQARNRRSTLHVEFRGETRPLSELCENLGMTYRTVQRRLEYGWSVEKALTTPVAVKHRRKQSSQATED